MPEIRIPALAKPDPDLVEAAAVTVRRSFEAFARQAGDAMALLGDSLEDFGWQASEALARVMSAVGGEGGDD